MRNFGLLTLLILVLILGLLPSCSKSDSETRTQPQAVSSQGHTETAQNTNYPAAPDFNLIDSDGNSVSLEDFKGKVIILDFWATWCGPCRMEIPGYVKLYDKYQDQGLEIIGVSLDRDGWKPVKPFMDSYNINYPIVMGNMQIVQAYGGIQSIPTTFVINRQGKVVDRKIGARPIEYYEKILAELL